MAQPKRILIVDDEEFNRELLEGLVETFGYVPETASDGHEALRKITPDIDLVLLDAMMPGMDGFEVARRTRANREVEQIPIVMVTALTSKEDRLRAVEAGANDFITKPIDRTELRVRMTSLLKMKEAQDAIKRSEEDLRARNVLMQTDLDLARAMQEAFILKQYPNFPPQVASGESALSFCHRYIPASTLGGDFFDVLALSETQAGVFICDVMGHGVRSALVTAMMRALVGERNASANDPAKFLEAINRHLLSILEQANTPMFASAFYFIADVEKGQICYSNAGHPSAIHVRRSDNSAQWLLQDSSLSGPVLGLFPDVSYTSACCDLGVDDLLLLFTDGIFEVNNKDDEDDEFGEDRVLEAVRKRVHLPTGQIFDELLAEVRDFAGKSTFEDDVCLIGMEVSRQDN